MRALEARLRALAALLAGALAAWAPAHAQEEAVHVAKLACGSGPWRIKLPKSYSQLRRMAPLMREKILDVAEEDGEKVTERELRFTGLEVVVFTHSARPNQYVLSRAVLTHPRWRIAGPLRVGTSARLALKGIKFESLPSDGDVELNGDADTIYLTIANGRIQDIEYDCEVD